ncbi:MAG TPA: homocysteine methyltransferase [Desulfobacteraceae bacterium]|nr:homocysteine methyltransferase [Desulfobacteraceae bacterium]
MTFITSDPDRFKITLEVVPPEGADTARLMDKILPIANLSFDAFSVASNPVAKPRMSAMAFAALLQQKTGNPAILHLTVRDHNRLGLTAELWGAKAMGIDTVIAVTGDPSAKNTDHPATTVNDLNVFEMITLAKDSGMTTGAVLDFRPEVDGLAHEIKRIEKKAAAGASFIVTQPVYDSDTANRIKQGIAHVRVPVLMGILPLLTARHARFLHEKVAGIAVPQSLREAMDTAANPLDAGIENACDMLALARHTFAGACVMPPFERFDILDQIL